MKLIGSEEYLGSFKVESGALTIGDPCYSPDTWCLGHCCDVLDGNWVAKSLRHDMNDWGERNTALFAFNVDYIEANHEIDDIDVIRFAKGAYKNQFSLDYNIGELCVDSGQAGIYDHKHYLNQKKLDEQETRKDEWLWTNGAISCVKKCAGVLPDEIGCVSSSGYGDGAYDYYCYYNKEGYTVAVLIVFIECSTEEC